MKIAIGIGRKGEQGQTIALMALSLVSLLGLAALAIDVSALYVARNEAQRAADAAALAGARVFATSSFATIPVPTSFPVPTQVCGTGPGSSAAVNKLAVAAAHENSISNQPATITNITCDLSQDGNPQVTVVVKQNNLSTFFSRVWTQTNISTSATATAEAYNASGQDVAVQVTGAKPWLLANCDENSTAAPQNTNCAAPGGHYRTFINSNGTLTDNGSYIGNAISLTKINPTLSPSTFPTADNFYGLDFGATPAVACPTGGFCAPDGDYRDDIQCSSPVTLKCGDTIGGASGVTVRTNNYSNRTRQATRCLIHSEGDNMRFDGQDILHFPGVGKVPIRFEGGTDNPNPALQGDQNISRSDSLVTVPLYDGSRLCNNPGNCNVQATIVGFMQLGIMRSCTACTAGAAPNDANNCACPVPPSPPPPAVGTPHLQAIIINAVGCKPGAPTGGVASSRSSPIAVRLIHQ